MEDSAVCIEIHGEFPHESQDLWYYFYGGDSDDVAIIYGGCEIFPAKYNVVQDETMVCNVCPVVTRAFRFHGEKTLRED